MPAHKNGRKREQWSILEEWRGIPTYEGYQASSLGRIRNVQTGRVLSLKYDDRSIRGGYWIVRIGSEPAGTRRTHTVSRLVCAAFHGYRTERWDAGHVNDDQTDNRAENLTWEVAPDNRNKGLANRAGGKRRDISSSIGRNKRNGRRVAVKDDGCDVPF